MKKDSHHTNETKIKLSEIHKGKIGYWNGKERPEMCGDLNPSKRPEVRKKISENKERANKISKALVGKPKSEEHRRKISITLMGHPVSQAFRKIISEANKGENNHNWNNGSSFLPYCPKFNHRLKEQIRIRDNRTCQYCNKIEIQNKERLSIHHIHYDKKNCNKLDLISLCRSCNAKVNKNREYYEKLFMEILEKRNLLNWKFFEELK